MQAIIMAAGKGQRLCELTGGLPKSFLEINGKTLIEYNIDMLRGFGITDIIIITGYRYDVFEEKFKNDNSISLVYNPFFESANVLASFWVGQQFLHEDFIYLHADTICERSILSEAILNESDIVLPVDFKPCDEEAMKVRIVAGKVVEINKTMNCYEASGEFIGIAKFKNRTIPALKENTIKALKDGLFGSYFEESIQRVVDKGVFSVDCVDTKGRFWAEIDFAEDYERAKSFADLAGQDKFLQQ